MTMERHHLSTRVRKLGGSPIRGGGTFRCSEIHCSCGWDGTNGNGQTYAESMQEGREHLKEVGVYTTKGEQAVYALIGGGSTFEQIVAASGKKPGYVWRTLVNLIGRGHVVVEGETYSRTDKWFSWND